MHKAERRHGQFLPFHYHVASTAIHVEVGKSVSCRKRVLFAQVEGKHAFDVIEYRSSSPVLDLVESLRTPYAGDVGLVADVQPLVDG